MEHQNIAKILSVPRLTTLVVSTFVSLCSGTNYAFSAYAPQLGSRLHISHTKLNVIGLAGNIGVYGSGVIWGRIVDRKGHKILLACAFVSLFVGYMGIRYFYDAGGAAERGTISKIEEISHAAFTTLVICSLMTGLGSNGGLASSINAVANSFPDTLRASVTGLVISGFGLSAFFFSALAHALYPGDPSSFLLLLALGTSLPMILGYFFIRPIPLSNESTCAQLRHLGNESPQNDIAYLPGVESAASVYVNGDDTVSPPVLSSNLHDPDESTTTNVDQGLLLMNAQSIESTNAVCRGKTSGTVTLEDTRDVSGKDLLLSSDFWLLSVLFSLLCGTGLMYINNVGLMAQALYSKDNSDPDTVASVKWQSIQVSMISITSFAGRIICGISADLVKNHLGRPRSFCLCAIACMFVLSQVVASQIGKVQNLWRASALLGFAYGNMFGLYPTLVIEWFGLPHFSENWGYIALSPMVGGNLFSLAFGRNLDAHSQQPRTTASLPAGEQCYAGRNCYIASLYLTTVACIVGVCLSLLVAWKDHTRMAKPYEDYQEIPQGNISGV